MLKNFHDSEIKRLEKIILANPKDLITRKLLKLNHSDKIDIWRDSNIYYKGIDDYIRPRTGWVIKNKPGKTHYITPKVAPKLKNDNPIRNNKIYFYSSPLVPGCICIGQTKGDVEKRIKQEFKNTPEKPYKILHSEDAKTKNGVWFTDKDFHKFLNGNGYYNEIGNHSTNNEWFKIDIKMALKLFKKYTSA